MKKICFILNIILFELFSSINVDEIDEMIKNYDIKYEESQRIFAKEYLINKNLFDNDRLIGQGELRKILIDIILKGGSLSDLDDEGKFIYEELARIFAQKYYKRKKEIRGKDIYNLIDINEINKKYYQLNGEIPIFDEDEELNFINEEL